MWGQRISVMGVVTLGLALAACPGRNGVGSADDDIDAPPPFPTDFEPGPPPGDPPAPDPQKRGLDYLQQIGPQLQDPWTGFIENSRLYFPPDHPLNDEGLAAQAAIVLDRGGRLVEVELGSASGNTDFDAAVLEIVRDGAPFPAPPATYLSDDGLMRLTWTFARDRRQAGVATADIDQVLWPIERAVPAFLGAGRLTAAAERLAAAVEASEIAGDPALGLADAIAAAAVAEALAGGDLDARTAGVEAATHGRALAAAPALRNLARTGADPALRARAAEALGAIGDREAVPLLATIIDEATPETAAVAAAAAVGLSRLDEVARAWRLVAPMLTSADADQRAVALAVLSRISAPEAAGPLADIVADRGAARDVREVACVALGKSALGDARAGAIRALRNGLAERDASVRAACARGLAEAARLGASDRLAYWKVVELLKTDRDEQVRAAAALAAPLLEPARFPREMYILAREDSAPVLAALAEGLAAVPGAQASGRLVALLDHDEVGVRRAAARALSGRGGDDAAAVAARVGDADPGVRRVAITALRDPEALGRLLDAGSPGEAGAALEALARLRGRPAVLAEVMRRLASAPEASARRAWLAAGWLAAT
jgi:TonB family protein